MTKIHSLQCIFWCTVAMHSYHARMASLRGQSIMITVMGFAHTVGPGIQGQYFEGRHKGNGDD